MISENETCLWAQEWSKPAVKTVVGQRLKRSGMHWTVRGANAIIALRCLSLSGYWEAFWESRSVA
jgi:hypothetical protein